MDRRPGGDEWRFHNRPAIDSLRAAGVLTTISSGNADLAVRRTSNGTWFISRSSLGFLQKAWGLPSDLPTPADFDGDGKTNIAVWRPADGTWFVSP